MTRQPATPQPRTLRERDVRHLIESVAPRLDLRVNACCMVRRASDQTIADATSTRVNFLAGAVVEGDSDGMFSTADPTRLTVTRAGLHLIEAQALWTHNSTGRRDLAIVVDGNTVANDRRTAVAGLGTAQSAQTIIALEAGAVVEVYVYQTSGTSLSLVASDYAPRLSAVRLRAVP